ILQEGVGTVTFPALKIYDSGTQEPKLTILAMDADGDGIADCLPEKLQTIGDVTYYVGYRIIDHNSAINANTALNGGGDFNGSGTLATDIAALRDTGLPFTMVSGFYPSHVGMLEL